jgi:hypothetical protein
MTAALGAATLSSLALSDPSFAAAQTFLGNAANNALGGQLQVQITVDAGKITAIATPLIPTGRNAQYANYAVPILTQEALVAQSATIQGVSGASYISSAWKASLASAIAKAGSAVTGALSSTPVKTPAPVATNLPFSGGENESEGVDHEGQEGGDDGYRSARPKRTRVVKPTLTPAPSASPTPTTLNLTLGAGVIKKTITCVKGSSVKTVKSTKPKCPSGYTLKKK